MASVLFICKSNAGRSQSAEWFFKDLTKKHTSSSAGTNVIAEGKVGVPPGKGVMTVVAESGRDISSWKRKQVTPEMVQRADRVVVLMQGWEAKQYLPDYIKDSGKTVYWDIEDMRDRDVDFHRTTMEAIRVRVIELVEQLG
jgi:protein-tyrosine-phosphatase